MKLYGATRVPPEMLEQFLKLIKSFHDFRIPPLLSILKEYEAVRKVEIKAFEDFQKIANEVLSSAHVDDEDDEDFMDDPDVEFEAKTMADMDLESII